MQDDRFAADLSARPRTFVRRFLALVVVVITINLCWQFFRAWMPGMLREQYGYIARNRYSTLHRVYVATDVGCFTVGFLVKWLAGRGCSIHGARMTTFFACSLLTALSVLAAALPASGLLLATLLVVGFGSLGQFPVYYAFTQELSARRLGRVTGTLSFITWTSTALVQSRSVGGSTGPARIPR